MNPSGSMYGWYFCKTTTPLLTYASINILDALCCAKGPICHRVYIAGPIIYKHRRFIGTSGISLYNIDCSNILPLFIKEIYRQIDVPEIKKKVGDLCLATFLSAVEVSGRTGWDRVNGILEQYILNEIENVPEIKS